MGSIWQSIRLGCEHDRYGYELIHVSARMMVQLKWDRITGLDSSDYFAVDAQNKWTGLCLVATGQRLAGWLEVTGVKKIGWEV